MQRTESAGAVVTEARDAAFERDPAWVLRGSSTIADILRFRAEREGDRVAYTFLEDGEGEAVSLTYGELDRRARALARALLDRGGAGERALLLHPPGLEFLAAFFGCLYAGVVAVPLYPPRPNRRDPRCLDVSRDADARFALTTGPVLAGIDRALRHSPELAGLVWIAPDELPVDSSGDGNESRRLDPDALAYLQYTSGSTRSPKGVMVTHQNLLATIDDLHRGGPFSEQSALVSWLPHFHDMGLVYGLLVPLALGVRGYLMPPASFIQRPLRWLEAISRFGATHSAAPNFAYELCVRRVLPEQKAELDLRRWAVALNGAEPVRRETLETFADAFRVCGFHPSAFSPGYGLAEATLKVTASNEGVPPTRFFARASELERGRVREAEEPGEGKCFVGCGRPGPGTEVLIVDPETLVPRGSDEVGEIWVDSPSVAKGYWNRPEESARVFEAVPAGETGRRRFLRTGDLGFLREGELFVTGRLKDLVIIRGRNHYPQDIELTVQNSHPALRADGGAAFAVEVDGAERLVVVHEVDRLYRQDTGDVAEIARAAIVEEHEIAPYAVVLVRQNGVPKTSSGKVQRSACARAFLERTLPVLSEWREGPMGSGETGAPASLSLSDVEAFLASQLSRDLHIPLDEIDVSRPFSSFGLDSAGTMTLLGEIEGLFGRPLSPTLFFNYPTISELAAHLAGASLEGAAAANGGD